MLKRAVLLLFVFTGALVLLNICVSVLGMHTGPFKQWAGEYHPGVIVEVRQDGFIIEGRNGRRTSVTATPLTVIKDGGRTIEGPALLEEGEYVMVIGPSTAEGVVEAKVVRVFDKDEGTERTP